MYCTRSKPGRRLLLQLSQELEQVLDVRALLVEVERVVPRRHAALPLRLRGHALDADDAVHVPAEVVAVELDLQVRQPVERDPLAERLGQAVADGASSRPPSSSGSSAPTRWYSGIRGFGSVRT